MDHFYRKIRGWFDFEHLYDGLVKILPDNSEIVEIGTFLGQSTVFLAVEIINSGKNIKLNVVDTWEGSLVEGQGNNNVMKYVNEVGTDKFYNQFLDNIKPVEHVINVIKVNSAQASQLFENEFLDLVFIDGDHSYECCSADIRNWAPKIKKGGIIAGHDYNYWEVAQAVGERFNKIIEINNHCVPTKCWVVKCGIDEFLSIELPAAIITKRLELPYSQPVLTNSINGKQQAISSITNSQKYIKYENSWAHKI